MTRPFFCGLAALLTFDASGMLYLGHDALTKTVSNWVGVVSLLEPISKLLTAVDPI
jgi:hypothetical protein